LRNRQELSTPSRGITAAARSGRTVRRSRTGTFSSLSRDHETRVVAPEPRDVSIYFQLPLSGSQAAEEARRAELATDTSFNSLSRDHKLKKYRPDVIRLALDNFQLPLSGSLGIP